MNDILQFIAQVNTNINANDIGIPRVAANDQTLGNFISAVFVVIGAVATLYVLIGAFRYVIAGGGGKKGADVANAKNTILYAVIGMVISLLGFTIVQFILGRLF